MKVTKRSVNYRRAVPLGRKCAICSMFRQRRQFPNSGTCTLVAGKIMGRDVCDKWAPR